MQELKLSTKGHALVTIDDKQYHLRLPNLGDQLKLSKASKSMGADNPDFIDLSLDYLSDLGLPKEVSMSLDIEALNMLIEHLNASKKK